MHEQLAERPGPLKAYTRPHLLFPKPVCMCPYEQICHHNRKEWKNLALSFSEIIIMTAILNYHTPFVSCIPSGSIVTR